MKKQIYYGDGLNRVNIIEGLGDILWYAAIIIDELNASFEEVMEKNINKLKARYPDKFTEEHALNRNLDSERKILGEK